MSADKHKDAYAIVGLLMLIGLVIFAGPFLTILALQALSVPVELTFWTWLAVFWLQFLAKELFSGALTKGKKE